MAKVEKLSEQEVNERLESLPNWSLEQGKLQRKFKFRGFVEAFAFMTRVAFAAEKMNHHPEWSNVYNRVRVRLVTHSAAGLSPLDFELAARIDEIAGVTD
jgi:4a-hydroxytetrahydrobiopterin dehydratase